MRSPLPPLLLALLLCALAAEGLAVRALAGGALASLRRRVLLDAALHPRQALVSFDEDDDSDEEAQHDSSSAPIVPIVIEEAATALPMPVSGQGVAVSNVRVAVIHTREHSELLLPSLQSFNSSLLSRGIESANVFFKEVPEPFDLAITARFLAMSKCFDVIVCLAVLDADHVFGVAKAHAATSGLMQVSLDNLVPVVVRVLPVTEASREGGIQRGREWSQSAVEMGLMRVFALGLDTKAPKGVPAAGLAHFPPLNATQAPRPPPSRRFGF